MNFRSIKQLSDQLITWSVKLPRDIDVVVGIPRSGLLAANILALYKNLPLTDFDGFLNGRCIGAGQTRSNPLNGQCSTANRLLEHPRNVLVVDDSLWSGKTVQQVRNTIEAAKLPHRVRYGVVYVKPGTRDAVDYSCEELPTPRMFEWNVFHHLLLRNAIIDMDGLMCADSTEQDDDDGIRDKRVATDAPPVYDFSAFLGYIVTSRPSTYRRETERWLYQRGIRYGELIMKDRPDGERRTQTRPCSAHKAQAYRNTSANVFIEHDLGQAIEIASLAKKDVLCVDTMQLVKPGKPPVARPAFPAGTTPSPSLAKRFAWRMLRELDFRNLRQGTK